MDADEYRAELLKLWMMAKLLLGMPLDEMLAAAAHAEGIGPFIDPTAWRQNIGKLQQDKRLIAAFSGVRNELLKMAREGAPALREEGR